MNNLHRSKQNQMLGGVAGGLAEYFDVDVALMRLIWVVALFSGVGILAYIVCWIVIPEAADHNSQHHAGHATVVGSEPEIEKLRDSRRRNAGLLLIGLGLVFLANNVMPWYFWNKAWPLLLVAIGLYILFRHQKGEGI